MTSIDTRRDIDLPREFYDHEDSDNTCYLCNEPQYKLHYTITRYDFPFQFKTCRCGLVKQTPMPNERFFDWFYNSDVFFSAKQTRKKEIWGFYDYFTDEPSRLATSKRRYKTLSPLLETGHPLEILKIGPSTGSFLYVANQHGHHAIGCDISSRFVQYAREHYNVQIDRGRFEHLNYADAQFDVILLFNVVENVPNQAQFFESVRRTLKPGGLFILNFVDMTNNLVAKLQRERYFLYRPPICYIYTLAVMKRVLAKFGFQLIACHRDIRYLHIEKISTLLGWQWPLLAARWLGLHRANVPVYAYPSRILISRKNRG